MLTRLSIRDFVIVDHTELEFRPGFTVLSGETGAGKSILLDALGLLMGDKGDATLVRQGASRAELEAEFDASTLLDLPEWLDEQGFSNDDTHVFVRRLIDGGGRSRCFINGAQATTAQLKDLGERLVDIHGQHAHQSLMKPDLQRQLLDGFAGATDLAKQLKAQYQRWQNARDLWARWQNESAELEAQREAWLWQAEELGKLAPLADEWDALHQEHQRLTHGVELIQGAQGAAGVLADEDTSVNSLLRAALHSVDELKAIDPQLQEVWSTLQSASEQILEAARDLRHYSERVDVDPERLQELDTRLSDWMKLARKYRQAPESLPAFWATVQSQLADLEATRDGDGLEKALAEAEKAYYQLAQELSAKRASAAAELSRLVTAELAELAMASHRFEVALTATEKPGSAGLEMVEFQVSPHESMPLRSLAKTASGGELSRISLAIQVVTAQIAAVPTLIFDEVDVGIGGRVAEIVGRKLRQLGDRYQVMCVTHLPQVAAYGHQHWQVAKVAGAHGVSSKIVDLSSDARVEEVARMLGGIDLTNTTRDHARELLGKAVA